MSKLPIANDLRKNKSNDFQMAYKTFMILADTPQALSFAYYQKRI